MFPSCNRSNQSPAVPERRKATTGFMLDCCTPGRQGFIIGATVSDRTAARAWFREYYKTHKQEEVDRKRVWRKNNRDKVNAAKRRYAKTHKRKYKPRNKEERRRASRTWRLKHPEVVRMKWIKRKLAIRSATVANPKPIMAWERRWRRKTSVRCYWCNCKFHPKNCHTDHITPLALNGAHAIENLCISCGTCNMVKGSKPLSEWVKHLKQPALL